jgi:hypothetical protein
MTDSVFLVESVKAFPVLLGGLLALTGGVVSQLLVHCLTERRERRKRRLERIEALVKAIYEHDQWISDRRTKMIFQKQNHESRNPLDEARMIQALHFPELQSELLAIQRASLPLYKFIDEQYLKHLEYGTKLFLDGWDPTFHHEKYELDRGAAEELVQKARTLLDAH